MDTQRYTRGLSKLREVDGRAGEEVMAALEPVCPDLARYVVEFGFGDIYSRPGLSLREREIATVAALSALGYALPQLKVHVRAALNVGITPAEIMEVIIQMAAYAGFPATINAALAAGEVLADSGLLPPGAEEKPA
ncbi:carboxymuconolactone decarboxylase family protein [Desulfocurvibacter africanus]|uniref:carboxymuconolactone decarboxylase family protein n=1 Tax=Desulfocurvibacter africanus TaxID=873 RepID=UPI002FDA89E4